MNAPKNEQVSIEGVTSESLKAQYEEISILFDAVRKLNIPIEDMKQVLPIKFGKAPRSGEEIPKLNIVKLKAERKQVRENSVWFRIVVNNEMIDEPIGFAVKEAFNISLQEFLDELKTLGKTIYDLVDGEEITFRNVSLTCQEVD
jgi:hypothetical protein